MSILQIKETYIHWNVTYRDVRIKFYNAHRRAGARDKDPLIMQIKLNKSNRRWNLSCTVRWKMKYKTVLSRLTQIHFYRRNYDSKKSVKCLFILFTPFLSRRDALLRSRVQFTVINEKQSPRGFSYLFLLDATQHEDRSPESCRVLTNIPVNEIHHSK